MRKEYPCPCGGRIKWQKKRIEIQGVDCGILDVEYCPRCGSEYFPEQSMVIIEENLKKAALWGMKRKEITFWRSGNTVVMRLPVNIARNLNLKASMKGLLYQEGKNKLVIEI
ncbi:MAG: hypothetical protein WBB67_12060 [bacterium]